jgi:hypothetical protein
MFFALLGTLLFLFQPPQKVAAPPQVAISIATLETSQRYVSLDRKGPSFYVVLENRSA